MADIILNNQYIKVTNADGSIAVADFFERARVETLQTVQYGDIVANITATGLPDLPKSGLIEKDKLYNYSGTVVHCIQTHERTIYEPSATPALFAVYRVNTDTLAWIENEKVCIGWKRVYKLKTYECIQAHMTLKGWEPDVTLALWKEVTEEIQVWVQPTGSHDSYNKGDKVYFPTTKDPIYESLIDANVWSPTVYPAGWKKL